MLFSSMLESAWVKITKGQQWLVVFMAQGLSYLYVRLNFMEYVKQPGYKWLKMWLWGGCLVGLVSRASDS